MDWDKLFPEKSIMDYICDAERVCNYVEAYGETVIVKIVAPKKVKETLDETLIELSV